MDLSETKAQIIKKINDYFSGDITAYDLNNWALEQRHFIEKKKTPSLDDMIIDHALGIMVTLGEEPIEYHSTDDELREAYEFLTGKKPFPEKYITNSKNK